MLNKERIKLMTKIAIFEQNDDSQALKINDYLRKDYISVHVIKTVFSSTIAYILACFIFLGIEYKRLLSDIQEVNLFFAAILMIAIWLIVIVCFAFLSRAIYKRRHTKAKEKVAEYISLLRQLDDLYKDEGDKS